MRHKLIANPAVYELIYTLPADPENPAGDELSYPEGGSYADLIGYESGLLFVVLKSGLAGLGITARIADAAGNPIGQTTFYHKTTDPSAFRIIDLRTLVITDGFAENSNTMAPKLALDFTYYDQATGEPRDPADTIYSIHLHLYR